MEPFDKEWITQKAKEEDCAFVGAGKLELPGVITVDVRSKHDIIVEEMSQILSSRMKHNDPDGIAVTAEMMIEIICAHKEGAEDKGPIILHS